MVPLSHLKGAARNPRTHPKKQIIFAQGDAADAVFYIKRGKVKVTVVSTQGKEAVVAILGVDELMDMARTSVNLLGNCLATAVVARWEGVDLSKAPAMPEPVEEAAV